MTMQAGPMGMNLSNTRVISSVAADGQAAGGGVQVNDVLCAVAGESVLALSYDDVLRRIREGTRPLRLTFVRPAPAQAAPPPPTAFASLFNPKLPNAASMTQGVKAAGSFMKGLLGASVQVIAGMDKIIGGAVVGAVDASTRQASVSRCPLRGCLGAPHDAHCARCLPPTPSPRPPCPCSKSLPRPCTAPAT